MSVPDSQGSGSLFSAAEWNPDWVIAPAPKGDDEADVEDLYRRESLDGASRPWDCLPEWVRESWRREYRNV